MNGPEFKRVYNEGRNGCSHFIRHPLVRSFAYSDGVEALANTGCHWLLDILATELPAEFRRNEEVANTCLVVAHVCDHKAVIRAEFEDKVTAWSKDIGWTDMPDGEYHFYIADEGGDTRYRCILLTEN